MKQKKYLPIIITGTLLFSQVVFAADLKQLAEQLVNSSIQPFEAKVYSETSTGTRFTSCDEAKAWNEKITALEKEGTALKKEMEKKRDESVLQIEKTQRVAFLDNFNQTIFPRLNRVVSSLKEVPLTYYCDTHNDGEVEETEREKEDVDRCGDGVDSDCDDHPAETREGEDGSIPADAYITADFEKEDVDKGNLKEEAEQKKENDELFEDIVMLEKEDVDRCGDGVDSDCDDHPAETREGEDDPIPGIDVIVERDPSVVPIHFDESACLDCGEEPVRLSDKTSEILVKAMPVIQSEGWKLELKKVDTEKYPKGTQAPVIPAKKVEHKKLFGLFNVKVELKAEINPQGEIQNVDKPWWSIFAW